LPTVLQCIQPKVREFGYFLSRGPDTKNATSVLGSDVFREEVVVKETITVGHEHSLRQLPLLDLPASNRRVYFSQHEVTEKLAVAHPTESLVAGKQCCSFSIK